MIEGIVFGNNPREGFERDGMFYHPDLEFQFPVPNGFQLINQTSAVVMVNEAQDAIIQFTIDSQNDTPESSVRTFLSQEGITVVEQQSFTTNSLNGYQGIATAQAQDGTELKLKLTAVGYGGNVYRFLSYTTSTQFDTYRDEFTRVENGFRQLYDNAILGIEPVRLDLVTVSRTAPFSSFLPNELPMDIQAIDIAIINQVEMDQTIQAGTVLKLPVQ